MSLDLERLIQSEEERESSTLSPFENAGIDLLYELLDEASARGEISLERKSFSRNEPRKLLAHEHNRHIRAFLNYAADPVGLAGRWNEYKKDFTNWIVPFTAGMYSLYDKLNDISMKTYFFTHYHTPINFVVNFTLFAALPYLAVSSQHMWNSLKKLFTPNSIDMPYYGKITNRMILNTAANLHDIPEDTSVTLLEILDRLKKKAGRNYSKKEIEFGSSAVISIISRMERLNILDRTMLMLGEVYTYFAENNIYSIEQFYSDAGLAKEITNFNKTLDFPNQTLSKKLHVASLISDIIRVSQGRFTEDKKKGDKAQLAELLNGRELTKIFTGDEVFSVSGNYQLNSLIRNGSWAVYSEQQQMEEISRNVPNIRAILNYSVAHSGGGYNTITPGTRESYALYGKQAKAKVKRADIKDIILNPFKYYYNKKSEQIDKMTSLLKMADILSNLYDVEGMEPEKVARVFVKYGLTLPELFSWKPLQYTPADLVDPDKLYEISQQVVNSSGMGVNILDALDSAYLDLHPAIRLLSRRNSPYMVFRRGEFEDLNELRWENLYSFISDPLTYIREYTEIRFNKKKILPLDEIRQIIWNTASPSLVQ